MALYSVIIINIISIILVLLAAPGRLSVTFIENMIDKDGIFYLHNLSYSIRYISICACLYNIIAYRCIKAVNDFTL